MIITQGSMEDFFFKVAKGDYGGIFADSKFGYNGNIPLTGADIWDGAGLTTSLQKYAGQPASETAERLSVVSTNSGDTLAGAGARKVSITGLDSNWDLQTETVEMGGTTPVLTTGTYLRCFRQRVTEVGASAGNVGNIKVSGESTPSNIFGFMLSGVNSSLIGALTVPRNKYAFVLGLQVHFRRSGAQAGTGTWSFRERVGGGLSGQPYVAKIYDTLTTEGPDDHPVRVFKVYDEKTDIKAVVDDVTNAGSIASVVFDYMFVDKS